MTYDVAFLMAQVAGHQTNYRTCEWLSNANHRTLSPLRWRITTIGSPPGRYRRSDTLLAFLDASDM